MGKKLKLPIKEAITRMCSVENVFLKTTQNSQEINCARVSLLTKLQTPDLFTDVLAEMFCPYSG